MDDVALGVALIVVTLTGIRFAGLPRHFRLVFGGLAVFGLSGAVSAAMGEVVAPGAWLGTWLGLKFLVCLLITMQFSWSDAAIRSAQRVAAVLIALVVAVAFVQLVNPDLIGQLLGARRRSRLGQNVLTSIFRQPAQYSVFMMFAISALIAKYPLTRRRGIAVVVTGIGALLSLRVKVLVDLVLIIVGRVAISPARRVRQWVPYALVFVGGVAAYLGAGLFEARAAVLFGSNPSARKVLYQTALDLAQSNLPLGAGFGSFGSEASIVHYSPVYAQYGLSGTYGFSEDAAAFVHDASWATVLGEAGWIGAAGFATALVGLFLVAWQRVKAASLGRRADCARAALLFAVAFVSDSITTPQLFAGFACLTLATLVSMSLAPRQSTDGTDRTPSSTPASTPPEEAPLSPLPAR
jgi:hypothetical protein